MGEWNCSFIRFKVGEKTIPRIKGFGSLNVTIPIYYSIRIVDRNAPYHYGKKKYNLGVWKFGSRKSVHYSIIKEQIVASKPFDTVDEIKDFIKLLKDKHGSKRSRFQIITRDDFKILN